MPYKTNSALPGGVKGALPDAAQTIFRNVFNSQLARGLSETRCFASAWAAIARAGYKKDAGGKWAEVEKAGANVREAHSATFTADIKKVSDDDQRLVFGWASIIEDDAGDLIVDSQGDAIAPDELEKAAYDFMRDARKAGEMHATTDGVGHVVESMVLTKAKREAIGLPSGPTGWWIGIRVSPEVFAKVKTGQYSAFSIGGHGQRKDINEDAT